MFAHVMPHRPRPTGPLNIYIHHSPLPVPVDYDRALPPLADQPLLELRRPSNKDACFAVSALSPAGLSYRRGGGDWENLQGRACLLDRYLGQDVCSPVQSPSVDFQTPVTPGFRGVPVRPKELWAMMARGNPIPPPPPHEVVTTELSPESAERSIDDDIPEGIVPSPLEQPEDYYKRPRLENQPPKTEMVEWRLNVQRRTPSPRRNGTTPAPIDTSLSLSAALSGLGSPPSSADTGGSITPKAVPNPLSPQQKAKFNCLSKIKTVTFDAVSSPTQSAIKSPTYYGNIRHEPSPSIWSPLTPVAMTFEYPIIMQQNTPPLAQIPWDIDDDMNVDEMILDSESPQEYERGRYLEHRGRSLELATPIDTSPLYGRSRSLSPPRSAYPEDSTFYFIPSTVNTPGGANDIRDRTSSWVNSKSPIHNSPAIAPRLRVGRNDRSTILGAYFHGMV